MKVGIEVQAMKSVQAPRDFLSLGQTRATPTETAQAGRVPQTAVASCCRPSRVAGRVIRRTAEAWSI